MWRFSGRRKITIYIWASHLAAVRATDDPAVHEVRLGALTAIQLLGHICANIIVIPEVVDTARTIRSPSDITEIIFTSL